MDINQQPGINFKGIILTKEQFWRDIIIPKDVEIQINFNINQIKNENQKDFNVELTTNLNCTKEKKCVANLECTFVGIFEYINGHENMDMDDFVKYNAPALMFPYIREHVSTTTQKAGMTPIYLAPINVVALINTTKAAPETM